MSISSVDSGPLHVKPEVDLNLNTEVNRVLYVLNKIVSRAALVGVFDEVVRNNGEILKNILDPNVFAQVSAECSKYQISPSENETSSETFDSPTSYGKTRTAHDKDIMSKNSPLSNSSLAEAEASDDSEKSGSERSEKKHDYNKLSEIIYLLEGKPEIRKLAESLKSNLSPEMKFFIKTLTEFNTRMEARLCENAKQYKTREMYMRETYEKNERAKAEIERLEEELLVTKTDANVCLIGRNILIKRHQNKINLAQKNSHEIIEKRVHESEKAMVDRWMQSVSKQERLKADFEQVTEKYSSFLKENLAIEKVLRTKRAKIENQVLGWIQKFDQDMAEKQAEEEEIQDRLDTETKELIDIQNKLHEQQEEYDELMQEKAEYEEEMLDRCLYYFILNRSARRIQRSFRSYKARKLAKKLARKNRKKKENE